MESGNPCLLQPPIYCFAPRPDQCDHPSGTLSTRSPQRHRQVSLGTPRRTACSGEHEQLLEFLRSGSNLCTLSPADCRSHRNGTRSGMRCCEMSRPSFCPKPLQEAVERGGFSSLEQNCSFLPLMVKFQLRPPDSPIWNKETAASRECRLFDKRTIFAPSQVTKAKIVAKLPPDPTYRVLLSSGITFIFCRSIDWRRRRRSER